LRQVKIDPPAGLLSVVVAGRPPEVAVFESVAVAADGDDFGVVDEAVDHGGGDGVIAEDSAPMTWNWHSLRELDLAF
jgi:hypothetical protein